MNLFKFLIGLFFALISLNPVVLRRMTISMMHDAADATRQGWMSTTQLNRQLRGEAPPTKQKKERSNLSQ